MAVLSSTCRNLFGKIDHDKTKAILDREMELIKKEKSERWEFDFAKGIPLENSCFVEITGDIPEAYKMRNLCITSKKSMDFIGTQYPPRSRIVLPLQNKSCQTDPPVENPSSSQKTSRKRKAQRQITGM